MGPKKTLRIGRGMRGSHTARSCDKQAQGTSINVGLCVTLVNQGGREGISESLIMSPPHRQGH